MTESQRSHPQSTASPGTGTRFDWASGIMLAVAVVIAFLAFFWPLLVVPSATLDGNTLSPFIFAVLLPIVIGIVVSQLSRGSIDPKTLAMLGVLSALGALARPWAPARRASSSSSSRSCWAAGSSARRSASSWAAPRC